ncbi:MAG: ABC transporter permease, partial [Phaeodactylibacter sp.]|nr:ABC transporter permease [Phaeodactylibacter sp.]
PEGYYHYLGTDQIGRDIAAGMVSGTRIALKVALIAMFIAALLGIFLGGLAGYYGDYSLKTSRLRQGFLIVGLLLGAFWGFSSRQAFFWAGVDDGQLWTQLNISLWIATLVVLVFYQVGKVLERRLNIQPERPVYVDFWVLRSIEVLDSIPGLFLMLAALAIMKVPSIFNVMVVIGLLSWTGIARFVRAEFLRIRTLDYIQAGRVMGFSDFRLLIRHALPNAIGPVLVTIAFGMAGAIILESTLSFLGIGSSADQISWGSLLKLARDNPTSWWLALFPGMAIFCTVMAFNTLGEALTNAMNRSTQ